LLILRLILNINKTGEIGEFNVAEPDFLRQNHIQSPAVSTLVIFRTNKIRTLRRSQAKIETAPGH